MRRFVKENSLGLFFGALFLAALTGQAIAGHIAFNEEQLAQAARRSRSAATSPPRASARP